jgi:hypothetical protein
MSKDNNNYIPAFFASAVSSAASSLSVSSFDSSSPKSKNSLSCPESAEDDLGGGYKDVSGCDLEERLSSPALVIGESVIFVIYCLASSGREMRESREA